MCIILGHVQSVSKTRIFAYGYDNRQLTVYSNKVAAEGQTMMILPVPYSRTIQFEKKIMKQQNFFKQCEESFEVYEELRFMREEIGCSATRSYIPVVEVGSYKISIAHTIEDLEHLDPTVFVLEDALRELLAKSYPQPFGFLCCRMKPGAHRYEPIAYTHDRLRLDRLFIPTRHYHTHSNEGSSQEADWAHEIYTLYTDPKEAHTAYDKKPIVPNALDTRKFPSSTTPPTFSLSLIPMRLWTRHGHYENIDLEFPILYEPISPEIMDYIKRFIPHNEGYP